MQKAGKSNKRYDKYRSGWLDMIGRVPNNTSTVVFPPGFSFADTDYNIGLTPNSAAAGTQAMLTISVAAKTAAAFTIGAVQAGVIPVDWSVSGRGL